LYAILNVSPDADPAVIEAAYKALMKKYHPDRVRDEPDSIQRKATEINQAFRILRDPESRAAYDHREQARQSGMWMGNGPDARPMAYQPILPTRRSRWPALLLIAILAALVIYVWQMTKGTNREQFASAVPAQSGTVSASATELPPVSQVNIDRAIAESRRVNQKMGLMGLSGYSQDCFASQSRSVSVTELDFCVAFDSVALTYDSLASRTYSLPELPRFQAREMMSRHLNAAKLISDDDAWVLDRLARIRSMAAERLEALTPRQSAGVSNGIPPAPIVASSANRAAQPARRATISPQAEARATTAPRSRPARRQRQRASDAEFMERQGYIY
jgi:curved DNA-binding protein CbpA